MRCGDGRSSRNISEGFRGSFRVDRIGGRRPFSVVDVANDCAPGGLFQFLKDLEDRARMFGWIGNNGTLVIPEDPADPAHQALKPTD